MSAEGMIEVDLHTHTDSSCDSLTTPESLFRTAVRRGLGAVAITDHGNFRSCERLKNTEIPEGLLVIRGEEACTEVGDIIGLFMQEAVGARSALEVIDEIHSQGGLVMFPHPYRGHSWKMMNDDILRGIDIIEGYNGRTPERLNREAVSLAEKLGKPVMANSDSHFWPEIGRCRTVLRCGADVEEIRKAVLGEDKEFKISGTLRTMKYLSAILSVSRETSPPGRAGAVAALPLGMAKKIVRGRE